MAWCLRELCDNTTGIARSPAFLLLPLEPLDVSECKAPGELDGSLSRAADERGCACARKQDKKMLPAVLATPCSSTKQVGQESLRHKFLSPKGRAAPAAVASFHGYASGVKAAYLYRNGLPREVNLLHQYFHISRRRVSSQQESVQTFFWSGQQVHNRQDMFLPAVCGVPWHLTSCINSQTDWPGSLDN